MARRLSAQLWQLSESLQHADVSLGEVMARLEGRVYTLLLVLLSLPFCQPIALPGLSTPLGIVIALLGLRFGLRQKPWLPKRLLNTRIPRKFLHSILRGGAKVLGWLEKFLHPRAMYLFDYRATRVLAGATVCCCGLLLLLPLPIPFSNMLPALTVVLLAASFSERDGYMLVGGGMAFVATIAFFVAIFFGGAAVVGWLETQFGGIFDPNDEPPVLLEPTPP